MLGLMSLIWGVEAGGKGGREMMGLWLRIHEEVP